MKLFSFLGGAPALPAEFEGRRLRAVAKSGMKTLRLRVDTDGSLRFSFPPRAPLADLMKFLEQNRELIRQAPNGPTTQSIPSYFRTHFHEVTLREALAPKCSIRQGKCQLSIPKGNFLQSPNGQQFLSKSLASIWKVEAQNYILQRLAELARERNLSYKSVTIRPNKTRWGSCGPQGDLNFSLYLMSLDFELIDYVLFHELAHLREKHHGAQFWNYLEELMPGARAKDQQINGFGINQFAFVEHNGVHFCKAVPRKQHKA